MKSSIQSRLPVSFLAPLGVAACAAFSGCSGTDTAPATTDRTALPPGHQMVAEYVLHVQPSKKKLTLHRLSQGALDLQQTQPGLGAQALIDAGLTSDGVTGSNNGSTTNNTVELVTDQTTTEDTYNAAGTTTCPANGFCADVTLNSFWTTPLNFTYAQATAITDSSGAALSGHSATNSSSPNHTGLDASLGLWLYQSPTIDTTHGSITTGTSSVPGAQGVMLNGVANGAKVRWKFANPDDADTYIQLRVVAAQTYSNYNMTKLTYRVAPTYGDACAPYSATEQQVAIVRTDTGALQTQPTNAATSYVRLTLPFDFTFYGTKYTGNSARVNFSSGGDLSLSPGVATTAQTPVLSSVNNTTLPSTTPRPGLFPWWDQTAWGTSGGMCAKLVWNASSNVGPNRQLVISWTKLAASGNGSSGPFVNFNVTFNESTDEIWFNYGLVTSGTGSAWSATIGAQDASGTVATGSVGPSLAVFPATTTTTTRYALQPIP